MTAAQLAQKLGFPKRRINRWCAAGRIRCRLNNTGPISYYEILEPLPTIRRRLAAGDLGQTGRPKKSPGT